MLDKCQNLVGERCRFRGEVTRLAIQGRGAAVFLAREAFAVGSAERVTFDPPVRVGRPLHAGTQVIFVERPRLLEPFPMAGEGDTYSVTFEVKTPQAAEVTLHFQSGGATPSLSFSGDLPDGKSCSGCTISWPPEVNWHVGLAFATAGPHPLSERFPGLPEPSEGDPDAAPPTADRAPPGVVVGAAMDVLRGELQCAQRGSEGVPLRAGETLSWAHTQAPEVDAVVWRNGAFAVELCATQGPARPALVEPPSPGRPTPTIPSVALWSPGFLAAMIGGVAVLVAAAILFHRRRLRRKPLANVGAGNRAHAGPPERSNSGAVDIFYSYSPSDEALRKELANHLSFLRQDGLLRELHEQELSEGEAHEPEIDAHLETADVILLLVSSDYAASDTLWNRQMLHALERAARDGTLVIPVLLRPCLWKRAPFAHLQPLPSNGVPITSWPNMDAALTDVAASLREAILRRSRGASPSARADQVGDGAPEGADPTPPARGDPPERTDPAASQ